jgi:hypothetical protein
MLWHDITSVILNPILYLCVLLGVTSTDIFDHNVCLGNYATSNGHLGRTPDSGFFKVSFQYCRICVQKHVLPE